MLNNFRWPLVPNEFKLPHLTYEYFSKYRSHPFEPEAMEFRMANAAWLTDLAFLAYADEHFIIAQSNTAGLTGEPHFIGFDQMTESTQCMVVHNSEIIVVVFRGTEFNPYRIPNAALDVKTDLHAVLTQSPDLSGSVHKGFLDQAQKIYEEIASTIARIQTTQTIWFAGHSMGGALAILTAKLYAARNQKPIHGIYTIGCPRVGDATFAFHYQLPLYCFVNNQDPVTRMPTWGIIAPEMIRSENYVPMGEIRFLDNEGKLFHTDPRPPVSSDLLRMLPALGIPLVLQMLDHSPFRYSEKIWNLLS